MKRLILYQETRRIGVIHNIKNEYLEKLKMDIEDCLRNGIPFIKLDFWKKHNNSVVYIPRKLLAESIILLNEETIDPIP